jgi:hypothetical protein
VVGGGACPVRNGIRGIPPGEGANSNCKEGLARCRSIDNAWCASGRSARCRPRCGCCNGTCPMRLLASLGSLLGRRNPGDARWAGVTTQCASESRPDENGRTSPGEVPPACSQGRRRPVGLDPDSTRGTRPSAGSPGRPPLSTDSGGLPSEGSAGHDGRAAGPACAMSPFPVAGVAAPRGRAGKPGSSAGPDGALPESCLSGCCAGTPGRGGRTDDAGRDGGCGRGTGSDRDPAGRPDGDSSGRGDTSNTSSTTRLSLVPACLGSALMGPVELGRMAGLGGPPATSGFDPPEALDVRDGSTASRCSVDCEGVVLLFLTFSTLSACENCEGVAQLLLAAKVLAEIGTNSLWLSADSRSTRNQLSPTSQS